MYYFVGVIVLLFILSAIWYSDRSGTTGKQNIMDYSSFVERVLSVEAICELLQ